MPLIAHSIMSSTNTEEQKKKKKVFQYAFGTHRPWQMAILIVPVFFIQKGLSTSVNTIKQTIANELGLEVNTIQWILHAENITICLFVLISPKINARFTIHKVFIAGCYIILFSNFCLGFLSKYFAGFIAFTIIAAIGYGLVLPVLAPFCNVYAQDKLRAKSIILCDVLFPVAQIFGSIGASYIVQKIHYSNLFFIMAGVGLIHCIYVTITLPPLVQPNKAIKFDILSLFLMLMFIAGNVVGFGFISFNKEAFYIIGPIIIVIGCASAAAFYYYNKFISKYKLLDLEIFNENTARYLGNFFLQGIAFANEVFFQSIIWQTVFGLNADLNGIYIGVCRIIDLTSFLFTNKILYRVCVRYIISTCLIIQVFIFLILAILLLTSFDPRKQYGILVMDMLSSLIAHIQLASIQFYTITSCPLRFGQQLASAITFLSKLRDSVGTAFGTAIQTVFKNVWYEDLHITRLSIGVVYLVNVMIFVGCLLISLRIGILRLEVGRVGHKLYKMFGYHYYDEVHLVHIKYTKEAIDFQIPPEFDEPQKIKREADTINKERLSFCDEFIS